MVDYEKEIQEMDSRPLEENNDIIYIKNKAESHNLDEDLVFLARKLIYYGFTGIEALSLVTKYSLAIKTKFNYSYLSIGTRNHKKDEKKEIILGLFEYLHRLTLDEDYTEEVIEKKVEDNFVEKVERKMNYSIIDYDKIYNNCISNFSKYSMDLEYIKNNAKSKKLNPYEISLSEIFLTVGFTGKEVLEIIVRHRIVIRNSLQLAHFNEWCSLSDNVEEKKRIVRGMLDYLHKKAVKNRKRNPLKEIFNFNIDEY